MSNPRKVVDYGRMGPLQAVEAAIKQTDAVLETFKDAGPAAPFYAKTYSLRRGLAEARRILEKQQQGQG
jgi:hypothetical protein